MKAIVGGATRVFLVDDHDLVIEGLRAALGAEPDLEIVGAARRAEEALDRIGAARPDVVIVDHRLGEVDGIMLCRGIAESGLGTRVVMLSAYPDQDSVTHALRAGACAYVSKESGLATLAAAVRAAVRGETMVETQVSPSSNTRAGDLRSGERRLLHLVAQGLTNAEIARMTGLTRETVKSYLRDLYLKLNVRNRAEAAAVALRERMI